MLLCIIADVIPVFISLCTLVVSFKELYYLLCCLLPTPIMVKGNDKPLIVIWPVLLFKIISQGLYIADTVQGNAFLSVHGKGQCIFHPLTNKNIACVLVPNPPAIQMKSEVPNALLIC